MLLIAVANGDVFGDEPPTVVPTLENVAVKRVAKQSSTWNHHGPDRAVDNFPTYLNPNQLVSDVVILYIPLQIVSSFLILYVQWYLSFVEKNKRSL